MIVGIRRDKQKCQDCDLGNRKYPTYIDDDGKLRCKMCNSLKQVKNEK